MSSTHMIIGVKFSSTGETLIVKDTELTLNDKVCEIVLQVFNPPFNGDDDLFSRRLEAYFSEAKRKDPSQSYQYHNISWLEESFLNTDTSGVKHVIINLHNSSNHRVIPGPRMAHTPTLVPLIHAISLMIKNKFPNLIPQKSSLDLHMSDVVLRFNFEESSVKPEYTVTKFTNYSAVL